MKKALAVLLALVLLSALVACKKGSDETDDPPEEHTGSPAPAPTQQQDNTAGPGSSQAFGVKYIDFGYAPTEDPFSRPAYDFAHIIMMHEPFTQLMVDMYVFFGSKLNYTITSYSSYRNADLFISLIESAAEQGVDGMIIDADFGLQDRVFEITRELGVVYMPGLAPCTTIDGKFLRPSATLDDYGMGRGCVDYMLDNYANHTGATFAADDIGLITVGYGANKSYNARRDGAVAAYRTRYPRQANTNCFNLDTATEPTLLTAEAAYGMVTETLAANGHFKGWLVFGVSADFADGASRALEDMGHSDASLVTCVAADKLAERWSAGYDSCWVAYADTPPIQWAHATISGLMLLVEGIANLENLWQQYKDAGQDYTVIMLPFSIVNKANYDDYIESIDMYTSRLFT